MVRLLWRGGAWGERAAVKLQQLWLLEAGELIRNVYVFKVAARKQGTA